jgi:hypothetical protein
MQHNDVGRMKKLREEAAAENRDDLKRYAYSLLLAPASTCT